MLAALCRPYKGRSGFASPAADEQIAEELFLAVDAVRAHLKVLYAKLGVEESPPDEKRVRLVERAFSAGLISEQRPLGRVLSPGSIFAGYEIESVVGVGGIGTLYRARQMRLDRPVALKLVAPEMARDPVIRERLRREARTVAALDHPNIVPLYEAGEADGTVTSSLPSFVVGVDSVPVMP